MEIINFEYSCYIWWISFGLFLFTVNFLSAIFLLRRWLCCHLLVTHGKRLRINERKQKTTEITRSTSGNASALWVLLECVYSTVLKPPIRNQSKKKERLLGNLKVKNKQVSAGGRTLLGGYRMLVWVLYVLFFGAVRH